MKFYKMKAATEDQTLFTRFIAARTERQKEKLEQEFYQEVFTGFNGNIETVEVEHPAVDILLFEVTTKAQLLNESDENKLTILIQNLNHSDKFKQALKERAETFINSISVCRA